VGGEPPEDRWGPSWGVAIATIVVGLAFVVGVWAVNYWQAFGR
jgi:hypothetical protein